MKKIVLVNYGGPQNSGQIEAYLFRLFSDRNVIRLPLGGIFQNMFARFVSRARSKKVRSSYETIGGSPILKITKSLTAKLNEEDDNKYFTAMAYTEPFIHGVLESISDDEVYIFPLFPHYSNSTTGTCLEMARETSKTIFYLNDYWNDDLLNRHIAERIREHMRQMRDDTAVVLSAHSTPLKYVKRGDPYLKQIQSHFAVLQERLKGYSLFLAFQSKMGPVKWAGPDIRTVLTQIKEQGCTSVVVYPLSFLIDNYETLYELDILIKNEAVNGINIEYSRIDCLNDSDAMVDFIHKKVEEDKWLKLE